LIGVGYLTRVLGVALVLMSVVYTGDATGTAPFFCGLEKSILLKATWRGSQLCGVPQDEGNPQNTCGHMPTLMACRVHSTHVPRERYARSGVCAAVEDLSVARTVPANSPQKPVH
jgi:hypothetical protein